jgi:hypothetical protein
VEFKLTLVEPLITGAGSGFTDTTTFCALLLQPVDDEVIAYVTLITALVVLESNSLMLSVPLEAA